MQARVLVRATTEEVPVPAAAIRLRVRKLETCWSLMGITTDQAKAELVGVNPATYSRVTRGITAPGERFIAGILAALPQVPFEDLFEVVVTDDEQVPA